MTLSGCAGGFAALGCIGSDDFSPDCIEALAPLLSCVAIADIFRRFASAACGAVSGAAEAVFAAASRLAFCSS
jgi:hypothetical protein